MAEEKESKILDLDAFIPPDKEVVIGKKKYIVRGDATVKMTLALMKNVKVWEEKPESDESMDALFESIKGYFKTPITKEILIEIGNRQLPRLLSFLYNKKFKEVEEDEEGEEGKNEKSQSK